MAASSKEDEEEEEEEEENTILRGSINESGRLMHEIFRPFASSSPSPLSFCLVVCPVTTKKQWNAENPPITKNINIE